MATAYINEDHAGAGDAIAFPNLRSCLGVALKATGRAEFVGTHLTVASSQEEWDAAVGEMRRHLNGTPADEAFLIGNLVEFRQHRTNALRYPAQIALSVQAAFGIRKQMKAFNTVTAAGGGDGAMAMLSVRFGTEVSCGYVGLADYALSAELAPTADIRRIRNGVVMPALPGTRVPTPTKPWIFVSGPQFEYV